MMHTKEVNDIASAELMFLENNTLMNPINTIER